MKRTGRLAAAVLAVVCGTAILRAEVKVTDKSRVKFEGALGKMFSIFGGKAAREGTTSTTAIKGDRKLTSYGDTGVLVDLQEEKVYTLDFKGKSYKVQTFAEMKQRRRELEEKAKERQAKSEERQEKSTEKPPDYEVDVTTKTTGQSKTINGFDTKEMVTTVVMRQKGKTLEEAGGFVLTSDMWVTPKIDALKERMDFERRYWAKMADEVGSSDVPEDQMAAAAAMYPALKDAMKRVHVEGDKLEGTPVQTTVSFDTVADPNAKDTDTASSGGGNDEPTPSGIGGFLAKKMMQRKKDKDAANPDQSAAALPAGHVRIMTIDSQLLSVSSTVAATDVALPEGFKQK